MSKVMRKIGGFVIGLCGYCTMATVAASMNNAEVKGKFGKAVKSVGIFTTVYMIWGGFMLLAYKLLDEPVMKQAEKEAERAAEKVENYKVNRDYEDGLD